MQSMQQINSRVIRRVGGLESCAAKRRAVIWAVIRRVGGLEYLEGQWLSPHHVIHRVGGLEDQAGGYTPLKAPFLTVGAFSRLPLT